MKQNEITVGAYDAKSRFAELLQRVLGGEEITITRHGTPVARLVPVQKITSKESRRNVIRQMRELASRNRLGGLRVRDLMNEGRK